MEKSILVLQSPKMKKKVTEITEPDFTYKFLNGQRFISLPRILQKATFEHVSIDFSKVPLSSDLLSSAEIEDVEASWTEIEEGKAKKFRSVDDLLAELRT